VYCFKIDKKTDKFPHLVRGRWTLEILRNCEWESVFWSRWRRIAVELARLLQSRLLGVKAKFLFLKIERERERERESGGGGCACIFLSLCSRQRRVEEEEYELVGWWFSRWWRLYRPFRFLPFFIGRCYGSGVGRLCIWLFLFSFNSNLIYLKIYILYAV
jgi:hypothetical protein